MTVVLIILWPLLSVPAGVFSDSYYAFWVLIAIALGFGAALVVTVLPLMESTTEIIKVLSGLFNCITGRVLRPMPLTRQRTKILLIITKVILTYNLNPSAVQLDELKIYGILTSHGRYSSYYAPSCIFK